MFEKVKKIKKNPREKLSNDLVFALLFEAFLLTSRYAQKVASCVTADSAHLNCDFLKQTLKRSFSS